ncbi:hypothetical protein KNE206_24780 [Kitasatospora sp. NE20-6]
MVRSSGAGRDSLRRVSFTARATLATLATFAVFAAVTDRTVLAERAAAPFAVRDAAPRAVRGPSAACSAGPPS